MNGDKTTDITYLRSVFDYSKETGVFRWKAKTPGRNRQGKVAGKINNNGYVVIKLNGIEYQAHRLAWIYVTGDNPCGIIDHINRVRADNRFSNLRDVSHLDNTWNQSIRKNNTSGYQGCNFHKNTKKWEAKIRLNLRLIHLGYYSTAKDAGIAYQVAKNFRDEAGFVVSSSGQVHSRNLP
ncbi:HNH endonuclease [Yokenella regensburgei]|uniref:HNH endonuclease n=1 Tax=Yokenella regensburgei TaxID=158877 RepID=A0ABX9S3Y3_9ENTR|nr:HNH endonuclease signature motif containing protein [Yokenella regensburgei]RKR65562.1 HNH endonuclease [Yokenella regensburgei]VFS16071.1 Uncharacterised protein [Yokenella regensburgei]